MLQCPSTYGHWKRRGKRNRQEYVVMCPSTLASRVVALHLRGLGERKTSQRRKSRNNARHHKRWRCRGGPRIDRHELMLRDFGALYAISRCRYPSRTTQDPRHPPAYRLSVLRGNIFRYIILLYSRNSSKLKPLKTKQKSVHMGCVAIGNSVVGAFHGTNCLDQQVQITCRLHNARADFTVVGLVIQFLVP